MFVYGGELETQAPARDHVPYHCVDANLTFTYEEIDLRRRTDRAMQARLEKEPTKAQVGYARNVVPSVTQPANPDVLRCEDPRIKSPGGSSYVLQHGAWLSVKVIVCFCARVMGAAKEVVLAHKSSECCNFKEILNSATVKARY